MSAVAGAKPPPPRSAGEPGRERSRRPLLHGRAGPGELLHRAPRRRLPVGRDDRSRATSPQRLLDAVDALGVEIEAILLTHCHFDHIGAVAPVARATGAPVYCPEIERPVLSDVMRWVPPGFGPFESYEADHTLAGGERLQLAGLDIEVLFTPGHSPGHLTYAIPGVLLSGDVLFQGSVGRVDLPGGDWPTLERSIGALLRPLPR